MFAINLRQKHYRRNSLDLHLQQKITEGIDTIGLIEAKSNQTIFNELSRLTSVCTCCMLMFSGIKGSVQQQLPKGTSWVKTDINNIPANAFVGGYEDKGKRDVYIGNSVIVTTTTPFCLFGSEFETSL